MSKLAHSNQETMDQIEAQALENEAKGKPQDPPECNAPSEGETEASIPR